MLKKVERHWSVWYDTHESEASGLQAIPRLTLYVRFETRRQRQRQQQRQRQHPSCRVCQIGLFARSRTLPCRQRQQLMQRLQENANARELPEQTTTGSHI